MDQFQCSVEGKVEIMFDKQHETDSRLTDRITKQNHFLEIK